MAKQRTKNALLVAALVAASLSTGCASRQYGYAYESADLTSSGKAVIAKGSVEMTTDSKFSERAFLGSPIYISHLHLTTASGIVKETSYEGAVTICIKKLLVWGRSNASPPIGTGCGAGIQDLTVEIKSGPQQATIANGDCRTTECTAARYEHSRALELRLPYGTKVRIALTEEAR